MPRLRRLTVVALITVTNGIFIFSSVAADAADKVKVEPIALEPLVLDPLNVEHALVVSDAYFRLMPPGRTVSAAFMALNNRGSQALTLVGLRSASAERVELHEHSHANGMMQMRKVEQLTIAAGESEVLEPGGYHLMLFGLPSNLTSSDSIDIELIFASGKSVIVSVAARSLRASN